MVSFMGLSARIKLNFTHADHALRFNIPNFQTQTTENFQRFKRSGLGLLQLGDLPQHLRQAIEGDSGVEMMDVMIADIGGEPGHHGICLEEAGRLQSSAFVGPAGRVTKGNFGKVMLSVEEIGADGVSDEVGEDRKSVV